MVELSGLDWEVSAICSYIPLLDPPLEVDLSDLPPLEVYSSSSLASLGGVGGASLFIILVSASKILTNYLISLSWASPT